MTRERWQDRRSQKRRVPYVGYIIGNYTFALSEIERLGPVFIADYVNKDECRIHFTIYFKSGELYQHSVDIPKVFTIETHERFMTKIFGIKTVKVPRDSQWYFDNDSSTKHILDMCKEIKALWLNNISKQIR